MTLQRILAAGLGAATVLFPAAAARATTVPSPIGAVTAEQYLGEYCDDFGADVLVSVAGGVPGATYTATGLGYWTPTASFVAGPSGAGQVHLHNVIAAPTSVPGANVGPTTVTVTSATTTVTVTTNVNCRSNKGD